MAGSGYDINLNIALKNSAKLMKLRKELKAVGDHQRLFNKEAKEGNGIAVATFNKLNAQLSRAKGLLNKAAYGTDNFKRAAQALVNVEKEHNHQLKERDRLLKNLRLNTRSPEQQAIRDRIIGRRAANFAATGTASSFPKSEGFLAFNKVAEKIEKGVKENVKQTTKTARILTQQATTANFGALTGQAQGFLPGSGFGMAGGQIGPRQPLRNRLGFGRNALPGPFAMQGGAMGRLRGGFGSAMIGGGFPALFGAGGLSSVMGGLAGGIGGALAPGGGFAASIAATAIAAQVQEVRKFRKAVRELNRDLEASGAATKVSRKEIKELAKSLNVTKEEAISTLLQFRKFSDSGFVNLAQIFGNREMMDANIGLNDFASTLQRIETLSEKLTLDIEFEAYKILYEEGTKAANQFIRSQFLIRQQYDSFASTFANDRKNFQNLGVSGFRADMGFSNNAGIFGRGFVQESYTKEFDKILDYYIQNNKEIQKILTDPTSYKNNDLDNILSRDSINKIDNILKPFLQDSEKVKKFLQELPEEFGYSTESAEKLIEKMNKLMEQKQFLEEFKAPQEELKNLLNPLRQILDLSTEIKLGFEDAFKGIIKGTMSVGDAFRSMLNRIADYFLDYAAQTAALGLQNLFLSPFKSKFQIGELGLEKGDRMLGSRYGGKRAAGGSVSGGKSYIVGEEGPEVFTPGISGGITPNYALGGSTSVVVNVDASGTSVQGSEPNGEELGRLIGAVVQSELIKEKRPGGLLS